MNAVRSVSFEVLGQCYSMKNSKGLSMRGGRLRTFKHPKAEQFERDFADQVPASAKLGIAGPVSVTVEVFYPSRRQDLDAELVYDLLQKTGVILNDRQIVEKHARKFLDPERPRVAVWVTEFAPLRITEI